MNSEEELERSIDRLDQILAAHDGYSYEQYVGKSIDQSGDLHDYSSNEHAVKAKKQLLAWRDQEVVKELEAANLRGRIEEIESLIRIYGEHVKASVMLDLRERLDELEAELARLNTKGGKA